MRSLLVIMLLVFCILLPANAFSIYKTSRAKNVHLKATQKASDTPLFQKTESRTRKPNQRDKQWSRVIQDVNFVRTPRPVDVPMAQDPLLPQVECIVLAADDRKAVDIKALRVRHLTEVTSFILVIEANSKPQSQAIANLIEVKMRESFDLGTFTTEGTAASGWVLMDFGSIFVHIMTPQMRNFYKIEKKWKDAEEMDISHLIQLNMRQGSLDEDESTSLDSDEVDEEDPFWR